MNLIFSYGPEEDVKLDAAGYTFLGAARDANGGEVHVFQLLSLEDARQPNADEKLEAMTSLAQPLVKHSLRYSAVHPQASVIPSPELSDAYLDALEGIRGDVRSVLEQASQHLICLKLIHRAFDGQEWDSSTTSMVAGMLKEVGFVVREPDEMEDED